MAKFEDYVKDDIDNEIVEANAEAEERAKTEVIPDRFKGKSKAEIAASFVELQALQSKQANDLGNMRKTVDQLLDLQSQKSPSPEQEETAPPVTVDDLYEDADGNIRRLAREESSDRIDALEARIQQGETDKNVALITAKYPDWQEDAQKPEFLDWVREKRSRVMLIQAADALDFEAAEELLGSYYEQTNKAEEENSNAETEQQLRDATLESGSPAPTELVDTYSRSELMELRINANQGDLKAQRYLAAHGDAIANAYADGRIID
jgi:hypothetical protein